MFCYNKFAFGSFRIRIERVDRIRIRANLSTFGSLRILIRIRIPNTVDSREVEIYTSEKEEEYLPSPERPVMNAAQGRTHTDGTVGLSQQQPAAQGRMHTAGLSQQQAAAHGFTHTAGTGGLFQQQAAAQGRTRTGDLPKQQAGTSSAPPHRDDHAYQSVDPLAGNKKRRGSKTPSKRPPSTLASSVPGDDSYADVMKERKRLLRLETKMTHEVKKKEAEYWHLKKMKLLSTITGEPVDTSQISVTLGPLFDGQLLNKVDLDMPGLDESDERNEILCALHCRSRQKCLFWLRIRM